MMGARARPRRRVLVVEDDADERATVRAFLHHEGHEVMEAEDGSSALALMRASVPDLVLLDLVLPVMSGWEFRVAQRQDPQLAATPVIAMTPSGTAEAAAVDADLLLNKPFSSDALLKAIDEVVTLSERRKDEARRAQVERMASLGTLAAGLVHEVNSPLGYVLLNLQRADQIIERLSHLDVRPELRDLHGAISDALDGAERIRSLTREIRVFARADDVGRAPVNVTWCVESALRVADHLLVDRARVVRRYHEVPAVVASEGRLAQVFLNLFINAAQAIPPGQKDSHEVRVRVGTEPSGEVCVEIEDTGAGIPEPHLTRIFEPFFSTKAVGEGSGLGLSICRGIVSALGGRIEVASEVGVGTRFRVLLPPAAQLIDLVTSRRT